MNAPAQIESTTDENALAVLEQVDADPKLILLGKVDQKAYFSQLREAVTLDAGDISTAAGRDRIKSAAQSIRTRKAAIDRTRKGLTEHWRNQTAAVNAVGKVIEAELDELIEKVRAPVTAWERAEEQRKAEAERIIQMLTAAPTVAFGMTSADVQERLDRIRGINLNSEVLGVRTEMAEELKADAVAKLTDAVAALKRQEEQARELEHLRAEQERQRIAAEQAEADRRAKEAAEAAAKAEAERLERAKAEAAEQARRDAEEAARREQEEREAEARRQIEEAERRAAEAEATAKAERQRLADLEAARKAAADAEAQEQARREADIAHRHAVIEKAADALTAIPGMTQKMARAVVNEIAAGNVPNVQVVF